MKIKLRIFLALVLAFIFFQGQAALAGDNLNAYLFYGEGCPHCAEEEKFLAIMEDKYPFLDIHSYEVYHSQDNVKLLQEVSSNINLRVDGVPFLVIGDKGVVGYVDGATSKLIEDQIIYCSSNTCSDNIASIVGVEASTVHVSDKSEQIEKEKKMVTLPIFGEVDLMKFSLPILTIILGVLDGFNPCAMWTLIFLISLLLGMKDRKKMWILGGTFIIISAAVYFIFMAAWLNLIMFLGFIVWVRILIGLLALFGGGYSLRDFFYNKEAACKVGDGEKKRKTFEKMKTAIHQHSFWLALAGIAVLAFVVNMVELVCSAGLPAVYTQVLLLNDLNGLQRYLYLLAYIFFYMIDDLFVFIIAMLTLKMTGVTTRYVRSSRLIGGIIMLIIGILLIFRPEWLMFG